MRTKFAMLLLILLAKFKLFCQVSFSDYSSFTLADSLKKNANAVYRLNEEILEITSPSKYNFKTHKVITLLNKDAAHHLRHKLYYDKFQKIENAVLKIYNAAGDLVKTYQRKSFETRNYIDDISFYSDDKLLFLEAAFPGYPCTIEIICEKAVTSYIALPAWTIATPDESVEFSSFIVRIPALLDIKHRELNIDLNPVTETKDGVKNIFLDIEKYYCIKI